MKLATFQAAGKQSYGLVLSEGIVDAGRRLGRDYPTLEHALSDLEASGLGALKTDTPDHALDAVRFLLPVRPNKVFCVLLNYEQSRLAQGRPKLQYPHIVTRFADTHVAPGDPLIKPRDSTEFDFEGEIAVVIGRGGRRIAEADALKHIAGITPYQDATPRDWMRHTRHFTAAKNFPSTASFGPWIATLDQFTDLAQVGLELRLNGEVMQAGTLGDLSFGIAQLVAYVSLFTRLSAGDIIATGTPAGSGYKRMPPRFLQGGDALEVTVGGVGTLRNPVADEA